jgi:hypothetical protein
MPSKMSKKTFTIFCIGTAHDTSEKFNIFSVMFNMVNATEVGNKGKPDPTTSPAGADHHKVIYDGPSDFPTVLNISAWKLKAAKEMKEVRDDAVRLIELAANNNKITVNLFGHSRGAITCLLIASSLWRKSLNYTCNLFLIDAVKVSDTFSLRTHSSRHTGIQEEDTRYIQSNVNEMVHFVMEDNVAPYFKLYKIEKAKENSTSKVVNIRIPGKHGTATQCNLRTINKAIVADADITSITQARKMWPIAGVVLSSALQKAADWGKDEANNGNSLPLTTIGQNLASDEMLFYYYNRIQLDNEIVSAKVKKRWINDMDKSSPGQIQKKEIVKGRRSKTTLDKFSLNPFRFNSIFVNQEHFDLLASESFLGQSFANRINNPVSKDLSNLGDDDVEKICVALRTQPELVELLRLNSFHWKNQPLSWDVFGCSAIFRQGN